ncbi:hypothetical protein ACH347_18885 [Saccharopolyspora sp. 5N102]|uniref:hypothetical protein n=1 Tax=Saccharopolyspora sp. 5N102 TaxID=3375155 RepID=UPI00379FDB3D
MSLEWRSRIYAALFLLGVGETLVDTVYSTLVPALVPQQLLGRANARLMLTFLLNNQLLGPLMFAAGSAMPLGFHALTFALRALIVARIRQAPRSHRRRTTLRTEVAEGLAWLWHHAGMRTLTACILAMNLTEVGRSPSGSCMRASTSVCPPSVSACSPRSGSLARPWPCFRC